MNRIQARQAGPFALSLVAATCWVTPARGQCPPGSQLAVEQQVLVHEGIVQGYPTRPFEVALWDPAKHVAGAQLLRVQLDFDATIWVDAAFENLSPTSTCDFSWSAHEEVELHAAMHLGVPKLIVDPVVGGAEALALFDGVVDFDGPSGHAWWGESSSDVDPTLTIESPAWLAAWTGSGDTPLPHTGSGSSIAAGLCDNVLVEVQHRFEVRLTVTYTFCEPAGIPYCFGDGSGAPCPCGNEAAAATGCVSSTGVGAQARTVGSLSVALDDLVVRAEVAPNEPALLVAGLNAVGGGQGLPFGDGLRCAGGQLVRLGVAQASPEGQVAFGPGLAAAGGWSGGDVRYAQVRFRDPSGPCGSGFNLTPGLELLLGP